MKKQIRYACNSQVQDLILAIFNLMDHSPEQRSLWRSLGPIKFIHDFAENFNTYHHQFDALIWDDYRKISKQVDTYLTTIEGRAK